MKDTAAMRHLVADVGGTNTRLAVADEAGVLTDTVRRFRNDEFDSFTAVARTFAASHPPLHTATVAIAGPVVGREGRLTNRNWHLSETDLARDLSVEAVYLLNDLEALGHAICTLSGESLELMSGVPSKNEPQAVVVGLGTGYNVALAHRPSGVVYAAEMGHASLPISVAKVVEQAGLNPAAFQTVEDLLSGRGLVPLHAARTGVTCAPEDMSATTEGVQTLSILADALGALLREIVYLYMPEGGVYFNGSLAQTLLSPASRERALAPLVQDKGFEGRLSRIPTYLLTNDASALHGCARYVVDRA